MRASFKNIHYIHADGDWREHIGRYWGQITHVDTQVGKILDESARLGLDDKKIVIFTSDHGELKGDFRMLSKSVQFESALRVPLMIRVPGISKGESFIDRPVSQVNLVPTLLEALGQPLGRALDGESLMPVIRGEVDPGRDVFIEWNGPDSAEKWCAPITKTPTGMR